MSKSLRISLPDKIGKGYKTFWNFKGRYRVCKGSRGSKKSTTIAQWIIYNMMKYPLANTLVVRQVFNTHKDSTWTQLKWAANNLKVAHLWKFSKSPLEATYIPTGQKILFRGLDDPMSITSITVGIGYLCWAWFEEAYQVMDEDAFNKIDMSIRGKLPEGYFKQITLSFNPWSEKHWLKKRFFDVQDDDILAITTTYQCNEWLGEDDLKVFEKMKRDHPKRYKVEGEGEWGIAEGTIYDYTVKDFKVEEILKRKTTRAVFGLDFGYINDPSALVAAIIDDDEDNKAIYIFDEHYERGMKGQAIAKMIKYKGYAKERIIADSSHRMLIDELKEDYGIYRIEPIDKGPDSVLYGIQLVQQYKIYVLPSCHWTQVELDNYIWDTKDGAILNKPIDDWNHLLDALRYAVMAKDKRGFVGAISV